MDRVINERLRQRWALAADHRLIVFQAPGGFGKTTAAKWWAAERGYSTVWLSMETDPGLRHTPAFWATMAVLLHEAAGLAPPSGDANLDDCLKMATAAFPDGLSLILDDYQCVANPDLDATVVAFVQRWSGRLQLLVCSREPVLTAPLARLQARGEATRITAFELRLDTESIVPYLGVPETVAETMLAWTGGWFYALRLVLEAKRQGIDVQGAPLAKQLEDYLFEEILGHLGADTISLMQVTALMDRFTLAECEALGLANADGIVAHLLKAGLFLEAEGSHFTYHALIRSALMARLSQAEQQHWHLQIATLRMQQDHESALTHFAAAQAWPQMCQAIGWFRLTRWLDHRTAQTTLQYWLTQVPGARCQDEPWYQLLYGLAHEATMDPHDVVALLDRAAERFTVSQDHVGAGMALYHLARTHYLRGLDEAHAAAVTALESVAAPFPDHHPLRLLALSQRIRVSAFVDADRQAWDEARQTLFSVPPVTSLIRWVQYDSRIQVAQAYLMYGEFASAEYHWRIAADAASLVYHDRYLAVGMQCMLSAFWPVDEVFDDDAWSDTWNSDNLLPDKLAHYNLYRALKGWCSQHWEDVPQHLEALLQTNPQNPWRPVLPATALAICHLIAGAILQRSGELSAANARFDLAQAVHPGKWFLGEIHWYLAWNAFARNQVAVARGHLRSAERSARRWDQKFLLARTLLLQAMMAGEAVGSEAQELTQQGRFDHALRHHFPEGAAYLEQGFGRAAVERRYELSIQTLGGLSVQVGGVAVTWKRSNAIYVLVDLLMNPEGSTAAELEVRYWGPMGNAGLRKDIQCLRQALEPDTAGRDSRFVQLQLGRYRWIAPPESCWWDAQAFLTLSERALAAQDADEQRALANQALSLYVGDFLPELGLIPTVVDYRAKLAERAAALRELTGQSQSAHIHA